MAANLNILHPIEGPAERPGEKKNNRGAPEDTARTAGGTHMAANINILQPIEGPRGAWDEQKNPKKNSRRPRGQQTQ